MLAENLSFDAAWAAVEARDASSDHRFVYAVKSTKIYCRASCPSRRPGRTQVAFFPTAAEAEAAGFRACRRCRPNASEPSASMVAAQRASEYLEKHFDESVTLKRLGQVVGMSPFHLQRTFKRLMGMTPREYAGARKMERLKSRLRAGDEVIRAVFEAGYASSSRAYESSRMRLGMTPAAYRKGGDGVHIRYTTAHTVLGMMLVATTDRGLCAVTLGDDDAALLDRLHREYPRATFESASEDLLPWVKAVVGRLNGSTSNLNLPLDIEATAFQWKVWKALQKIAPGATQSYGEIASSLGQAGASRAVARACAQNRLAVVIPCHRAVRADGTPGGYRWGVRRKRQLLRLEQKERVEHG